MSTKISWADKTWNPTVGCSKISAGCVNCYAEKMAHRQAHMEIKRGGPDRYGDVITCNGKWNGDTVFVEFALTKPLHWKTPRKIFVCSMSDLFHESVPFEWIDKIFAVISLCPQHTFLILTKRAGRMREYCGDLLARTLSMERAARELKLPTNQFLYPRGIKTPVYEFRLPIPNLHLGVTVENDDNLHRIDYLVETPAAERFVSFEPLLHETHPRHTVLEEIDCAFIGCESGPKARLCTLDDIRYLMSRCKCAHVKIHVKQIPLKGKCNKNFKEWPPEFQVREV